MRVYPPILLGYLPSELGHLTDPELNSYSGLRIEYYYWLFLLIKENTFISAIYTVLTHLGNYVVLCICACIIFHCEWKFIGELQS